MKALSVRTQQQWGIPEDMVSPLGWQTAVFELQGLEHNLTPSTQLHVLTRTVKAIYNEFKHVVLPQLRKTGSSQSCIAADDLVPIFIYIFCRSNLKHPMRSRDLMWSLCHPDQLQGEGGYYLTVFESSIEFVLNEEISRDSFAYSYNTNSHAYSAADEASKQYVSGMRSSLSGGKYGNSSAAGAGAGGETAKRRSHSRLFSDNSSSGRSSSAQFADAPSPGGVFDISGEYLNDGEFKQYCYMYMCTPVIAAAAANDTSLAQLVRAPGGVYIYPYQNCVVSLNMQVCRATATAAAAA
jgi:hypothetical protein